jgi:hypothetical protein
MTLHVASRIHFAVAVTAATLALTVSSNACARDDATAFEANTLSAPRDNPHATPADVLKSEYLMCEQAVAQASPDFATGMRFSMLYEALRQQVFGGSFDDLISWWRENKNAGMAPR